MNYEACKLEISYTTWTSMEMMKHRAVCTLRQVTNKKVLREEDQYILFLIVQSQCI